MEKMSDEWEKLHAEAEEEIKKAKAAGKKAKDYPLVSELYISRESRKAQERRRAANKCGKAIWGMPPRNP